MSPARYKRSPKEERTYKGHVYDSKREMQHAVKLCALYEAGKIHNLRAQVPYIVAEATQKGERDMCYVADFVFEDEHGVTHVQDVKGHRTQLYNLKKRLMYLKHGIRIEEV
jgi:hypothetical protein